MSRPALALALSMLALTAASPHGQAAPTGSISGRVRLTTRIKGSALPSTAYPARAVGAHDTQGALEQIKSVVVYLKDAAYAGALPLMRAELRQEHETFLPHVVAITRGSTVDFPNQDPIFHNVFSLSSAATFDLRRYPQGQTRSRQFPRAGIVKVYCHIHSHMSATIVVLDHPYFTIPQQDGRYELSDVPAGEYTLVGWHERAGERVARVRVERGKAAVVDLALPVEDAQ
jgi:plastocyanin